MPRTHSSQIPATRSKTPSPQTAIVSLAPSPQTAIVSLAPSHLRPPARAPTSRRCHPEVQVNDSERSQGHHQNLARPNMQSRHLQGLHLRHNQIRPKDPSRARQLQRLQLRRQRQQSPGADQLPRRPHRFNRLPRQHQRLRGGRPVWHHQGPIPIRARSQQQQDRRRVPQGHTNRHQPHLPRPQVQWAHRQNPAPGLHTRPRRSLPQQQPIRREHTGQHRQDARSLSNPSEQQAHGPDPEIHRPGFGLAARGAPAQQPVLGVLTLRDRAFEKGDAFRRQRQ
ncbi:uncharacterized protein at4g06744 [Phtheirospermum japonicum]|uniref:Uncharacterized protein at4g06744 n=1 Tax=Phtheirospermum japonicum TaxID=374723 RepID=A0A830D3K0_9LAMI|nr:uncharacterized protein at4g06744 [Phtheirospermum japonicum]